MATSLDQLERQRQGLEKNMEKLLAEWQQWKLEYESLKQNIESGKPRAEFIGKLIDEKELSKIFGLKKPKSRDQIISTLNNRIDYVRRNIETLGKQLAATRSTIAPLEESEDDDEDDDDEDTAEEQEYPEDDSLPVTEILEELDDDDNVVSYSLRSPGNNQQQLLEVLEKAGLKELHTTSKSPSISKTIQETGPAAKAGGQKSKEAPNLAPVNSSAPKKKKKKKSVTFAEDTKLAETLPATNGSKVARSTKPNSSTSSSSIGQPLGQPEYTTLTASDIDELMREAKLQEDIISDPVMPADDSEEDAQLRRDMLQYNLSELNPVVAELTLEEGALTDDDDDDDWEHDDDDDEDQWGRSTASVVNEEYRQKMLEIQERLQRQAARYDNDDGDNKPEGIATIRINTEQPTPATASTAVPSVAVQQREEEPLSDVVERKSSTPPTLAGPASKKPSRFKATRQGGETGPASGLKAPKSIDGTVISPELPVSEKQFAPSGPEGQAMAASVLERPSSDIPREPDEFDADILKQQTAVEYHKVRNRMIQKQGGFMRDLDEESPIRPLDEEEGGPKRMSRFKAARLAKS